MSDLCRSKVILRLLEPLAETLFLVVYNHAACLSRVSFSIKAPGSVILKYSNILDIIISPVVDVVDLFCVCKLYSTLSKDTTNHRATDAF